ncbi:MAG TPA: hypothetical protein VFW07_11300 [Parafilimonas sp.]|nr:hypothetical protein [Parafilimonas sp.]
MKLTIYRILSFLLVPMAILFAMGVLPFLSAAFANPAMLFPLFLIACIVIYSFASLNFLIKGIDGKRNLRRSSKDWIKVNAIVSIVFALLIMIECVVFLMYPEMMQRLVNQTKQIAGSDFRLREADYGNYFRITSYFFLAYAIVLVIHIIMSFQYLKMYNYLFQGEKN